MATPNYSYEKRQKELAKKRKKEDKVKRKSEAKPDDGSDENLSGDEQAPGIAPQPLNESSAADPSSR